MWAYQSLKKRFSKVKNEYLILDNNRSYLSKAFNKKVRTIHFFRLNTHWIFYNSGIKKIQIDKKLSSINSKHDILLAKSLQLDNLIKEEKELDEKITSVTPAKLSTNGMKDDFVRNSIKNCMEDLKVFYEDFDSIQSDGT